MIVRLIRIVISSVNSHVGAEFIRRVTDEFGAYVEETTASPQHPHSIHGRRDKKKEPAMDGMRSSVIDR
jgi:hypothetical protein